MCRPNAGGRRCSVGGHQEQLWTIDRIIPSNCASSIRRGVVEIRPPFLMPIVGWLRGRWTKEKVVSSFKAAIHAMLLIFKPSALVQFLNRGNLIIAETSRVYSRRKESIIHSVWAKSNFGPANRLAEEPANHKSKRGMNLCQTFCSGSSTSRVPATRSESVRRRLLLSDGDFGWEFTWPRQPFERFGVLGKILVFIGWLKDADGLLNPCWKILIKVGAIIAAGRKLAPDRPHATPSLSIGHGLPTTIVTGPGSALVLLWVLLMWPRCYRGWILDERSSGSLWVVSCLQRRWDGSQFECEEGRRRSMPQRA